MNWNLITCKLALIAGMAILAGLPVNNECLFPLRVAVIVFFGIMLFSIPRIYFFYLSKQADRQLKEEQTRWERERQHQIDMQAMLNEQAFTDLKGQVEKNEKAIKTLQSAQTAPTDEIKLFYYYLLTRWAKEQHGPLTEKNFDDINKEFEEFRKTVQ